MGDDFLPRVHRQLPLPLGEGGGEGVRTRLLIFALVALLSGCSLRVFLNFKTESVDEHVRLLLGGGGNSLILLHNGEAFLVDAKFGDFARRLRSVVETDLNHSVRRILLTHGHFDHAQGVGVFTEVGAVIVHPNAHARLDAESLRGVPFVDVSDEIWLKLGDDDVRIFHPGVGHTDGDLVAWFPSRKLLVAGDLITDDWEPFPDRAYGGEILQLSRTVQSLFELPFERVVTGHGEPIDRARAERYRDFFPALEREVRACKGAGKSEDACASEVTLPEFDFKPLPFSATREKSVRAMYKALP